MSLESRCQTVDAPGSTVPPVLSLGPATPNPARDGAVIPFSLARDARVSLAIYGASGRMVRELVRGFIVAGEHQARWDGRDASGREVPSALYFYRMHAEGRILGGRLVKVR